MAIYHCHFKIVGRSAGGSSTAASAYCSGSAVAGAAYRAGEKIYNQYDGLTHDYTRKTGVVHSEIMLPENAPQEYFDRSTLWNAVEMKNKRRDAQLARECDIALPTELTREEQIEVVREYVSKNFVDKGVCADFSIHDKEDGNPHAHIMLTMNDVSEKGFGGRRSEERGNGYFQSKQRIKEWRESWADVCNHELERKGLDVRIDHRTLESQGIDREPTIHLGHEAHKMEKKGIRTERGDINREVTARNAAKIRNKQIELSMKISNAVDMSTVDRRKVQEIKTRISDIYKYKDNISAVQLNIDNTQREHDRASVLNIKRKNILKDELKELEEMRERFKYGFRSRFNADVEQSDDLIVQLKKELHMTEQSGKPRTEEWERQRAETEIEYKKLKANAEKYYFFDAGEWDKYLRFDNFPQDINDWWLSTPADEHRLIYGLDREPERVITRGYDLSR